MKRDVPASVGRYHRGTPPRELLRRNEQVLAAAAHPQRVHRRMLQHHEDFGCLARPHRLRARLLPRERLAVRNESGPMQQDVLVTHSVRDLLDSV